MARRVALIAVGLVVSILHLLIFFSSWGEQIEPWSLNIWFNMRGRIPAQNDLALVSMDEMSYRELEVPFDKAWPRKLHAQLLKRLAEIGVKRVVFDVLFLGPSDNKEADQELAKNMKLVPTVIGADYGWREQGTGGGTFKLEEVILPYESFHKAAASLALVAMPEDFGYLRRFTTKRSQLVKDIPSMAEAGAGLKPDAPNLPKERDFIWYYGPAGTIPTYSYYQVLDSEIPLDPALLRDKVVFVGLMLRTEVGPAQKDNYLTPFFEGGRVFGVEIEATAAANLISGQWIKRASSWSEGIIMFFVTLALALALFFLRPQWGGLLLISFAVLWGISAYLLFLSGFFLPGTILVILVLPVTYLGSTFVYYLLTFQSQQHVEKAFQFYLAPEMAHQMRSNPKALALGGENIYATALFSDIEGFTVITEKMLAQQVSEMLNAYFTEVMDVIFEKKGTLIKFIGDSVFVIWGAPIKIAEHAKLACETAIAIQEGVKRFNASGRFPALYTRIGIHTGPMVVGNLGSSRRFDYTAIGDSVNLASRLEGMNKYFGTSILISDAVRKEIGAALSPFSLGTICVAGKSELIGIHTLFPQPLNEASQSMWSKALLAFRTRRWDEAQSLFEQISISEPLLSKPAQRYLGELAEHKQHPPKDEWQGEIIFSQK